MHSGPGELAEQRGALGGFALRDGRQQPRRAARGFPRLGAHPPPHLLRAGAPFLLTVSDKPSSFPPEWKNPPCVREVLAQSGQLLVELGPPPPMVVFGTGLAPLQRGPTQTGSLTGGKEQAAFN